MEPHTYFQSLGSEYTYLGLQRSAGLRYISADETNFIKPYLPSNKRVLDLGIGTGRLTDMALDRACTVTGVDITDTMLDYCRKRFRSAVKRKKLTLVQHNLGNSLPFADRSFDLVVAIRVMKYIPDWEDCIGEVSRVLRKGGIFIAEFSNAYSYESVSRLMNRVSGKIRYRVFGYGTCLRVLEKSGFTVLSAHHGVKLPYFMYGMADSPFLMRIILRIESVLAAVFAGRGSRSFILICRKT